MRDAVLLIAFSHGGVDQTYDELNAVWDIVTHTDTNKIKLKSNSSADLTWVWYYKKLIIL